MHPFGRAANFVNLKKVMIVIEDALLQRTHIDEQKLRMEIAATLYEHGEVSLRKAAAIAGVNWMELQWFLGEKGIYTYTEDMLQHDLETLERLKK